MERLSNAKIKMRDAEHESIVNDKKRAVTISFPKLPIHYYAARQWCLLYQLLPAGWLGPRQIFFLKSKPIQSFFNEPGSVDSVNSFQVEFIGSQRWNIAPHSHIQHFSVMWEEWYLVKNKAYFFLCKLIFSACIKVLILIYFILPFLRKLVYSKVQQ